MISNFREDFQFSMLKFGNILADNDYKNEIFEIEEIYPKAVFRKYLNYTKLRKWAAYIDKYIVFKYRALE